MASVAGARRGAFRERFALFAECLLTGVWFAVAALPLVTIPAALAAASRHIGTYVDGDSTSLGHFARDFRTAWRESWQAGLAVVGAGLLLALNLAVLATEGVPARPVMALLTLIVAALAITVLLRAGAAWSPGERWRSLLATAVGRTRSDLSGTGILVGGLVVTLVCTWALWLLVVPMSGCLVGAAVAVHRRARVAEED